MRSPRLALLLLVAGLAGCLGGDETGGDGADTAAPDPAPLATGFTDPVVAIACDTCGEATVAWTDIGLLVASAGGTLARSVDGVAFERVHMPPAGAGANLIISDGQLQTGPDQTMWLSLLYWSAGGQGGGIRVLTTRDAGLTWDTDVFVNTAGNPAANVADRQWLAFENNATYLLCNCPPAAAMTTYVSHDQGASFALQSVAPLPEGNPPWGAPIVGHTGLLVPHFSPRCSAQTAMPIGVDVARSVDGGVSWSTHEVEAPGGAGIVPCGFPVAAYNGTHYAVAWNRASMTDRGGADAPRAVVQLSTDGATWTAPVAWGEHDVRYPHPWIDALPDGRFALMSYASDGDVHIAIGHDAPSATWQIGNSTVQTDLPHFAVGPDGRIAAVWILDGDVLLARQSGASAAPG